MDYNIALIPGDGIGKEVIPAAVRVIDSLSARHGFKMTYREFPYSCEYYLKSGEMMPKDGTDQLRNFDAIFLGPFLTGGGEGGDDEDLVRTPWRL